MSSDYQDALINDLVEQFRGQPIIEALCAAVGEQLNDVRQYYDDLRDKRSLYTAEGQQLDGIGDIVCLSRKEAGELACINESVYVLEDDGYRDYLIYKIWRNTNRCTYYDILKAFRLFWPEPIYYREDPEKPATLIIETAELTAEQSAEKLLNAPVVKAAGVGLEIVAKTSTPLPENIVPVSSAPLGTFTSTALPEYEMATNADIVSVTGEMIGTIYFTVLPEFEGV